MTGLNKVILIGNLGRDPEYTATPNGTAVCKFSIATSLSWKDKTSGEKKQKTEWHRIVTFGKLAEICSEYLEKGKQVYIEGRLETSSWEKDGVTRYNTNIIASEMQMLGTKNGGGDNSGNNRGGGNVAEYDGPPLEDDIPF